MLLHALQHDRSLKDENRDGDGALPTPGRHVWVSEAQHLGLPLLPRSFLPHTRAIIGYPPLSLSLLWQIGKLLHRSDAPGEIIKRSVYGWVAFPSSERKTKGSFLPSQPGCCLSLTKERFSQQRWLSSYSPACQIPSLASDLSGTDPDC